MNTIKFGDKDSYKDWGLILKPKKRPLPTPKTKYVSIEGKDGDLDLTTSLTGDVKYQNISHTLEFTLMDKREDWEDKLYEISTYLHGKKMNVIFSDDPNWYYVGRMSLNELASDRSIGSIVIDCNFKPYKLKVEETIINEPIESGKVITLSNSRKWVIPTIETLSKNLLNPTGENQTLKGVVFTNNKDGSFTINGTSTGALSFALTNTKNNPIHLKKGKTYTQSIIMINGTKNSDFAIVPAVQDEDGNIVWNYFTDNQTKTANKDYSFYAYTVYVNKNATVNATFKVQLEYGNVATEYEPYVDSSANFTFKGSEYSVDGTLKTPNIILKEGDSQITLNSGEGNIQISYREGKL